MFTVRRQTEMTQFCNGNRVGKADCRNATFFGNRIDSRMNEKINTARHLLKFTQQIKESCNADRQNLR